VHGRWVIEIREPDGRLVSRREFENELQPSGQSILTDLLTHKAVAGSWVVLAGLPFCEKDLIGSGGCPSGGATAELIVVSAGGTVVLTGVAPAPIALSFTEVGTAVATCDPGTYACISGAAGYKVPVGFSYRTIPAQSVAAGQIVQVSVTISFSAAP